MIYNNVILTVKDAANIDVIQALLKEQGRMSREEPGCERFEVYHSQSDSRIFILIEQWASAEALSVHREAKASSEIYRPKVLPLVDRVPHPSDKVL